MTDRAVVAIIHYGGKVVLGLKRPKEGKWFSGKWHIPGETLREGESYEEGVIRCAREETGLEVRVGNHICDDTTPSGKKLKFYECYAIAGELRAQSDLTDIKLVPKERVKDELDAEVTRKWWPAEMKKYFGVDL
jgi:ADP-ribose pyrophosphatase YjhB (NUDIX family)